MTNPRHAFSALFFAGVFVGFVLAGALRHLPPDGWFVAVYLIGMGSAVAAFSFFILWATQRRS